MAYTDYDGAELLSQLLCYGGVEKHNEVAQELLKSFGGRLDGVFDSSSEKLAKFKGMTPGAVTLIKLIPDCANFYGQHMWDKNTCFKSTSQKGYYMADIIGSPPVENFYVVCLDKDGRVAKIKKLSEGGIAKAEIDIRKVVEIAIDCAATEVIVAHNHPSGNLNWSEQDVQVTRLLKNALMHVGIEEVDHFIVVNNEYISMKEAGVI